MKKIEQLTSEDIVAGNIEKLKQLFPTVFKEGKVVMEELQAVLGEYVEKEKEFYEFNWAGKTMARMEANKPSTGTLRPCKEESKNWDTTENIFIEGDNLEVLKLMQKTYSNRIKMIYIDPPYNTGKDFVYKDNYKDNLENYLQISGQADEEGKKLSANTESDGRYHSNWLNMMYPRLKLARNLLTDDGVIFISIDDNEQANLKKLCDEIFGEENFVANIIWRGGKRNAARFISTSHEYILFYTKNLSNIYQNDISWKVRKKGIDEIYYEVEKLRKQFGNDFKVISKKLNLWYRNLVESSPAKDHSHYKYVDEKGIYCSDNVSRQGGGTYSVTNPLTGNIIKSPSRGWVFGNVKDFWKAFDDGRLKFKKDDSLPILKRYLHENEDQLVETVFYKDRRAASVSINKLLGRNIFDHPKDDEIIKNLITMVSSKSDFILDFFTGSGTTAHAVMALNAEDGGNRKCISVQLPEPTDEKSEAYKAGYKTIAEIAKERIRRAGEKVKEENADKENIDKLDIGFRVFKLDSSNIKRWDSNPDELENQIDAFEDALKENRTEEDLLYEILLKYGLDLTLPILEKEVDGCIIYNIGFGSLYVCLSQNISPKVAGAIAEWHKESVDENPNVIFRDSGFKNDAAKTNAVQTLRQVSEREKINFNVASI